MHQSYLTFTLNSVGLQFNSRFFIAQDVFSTPKTSIIVNIMVFKERKTKTASMNLLELCIHVIQSLEQLLFDFKVILIIMLIGLDLTRS